MHPYVSDQISRTRAAQLRVEAAAGRPAAGRARRRVVRERLGLSLIRMGLRLVDPIRAAAPRGGRYSADGAGC
jgi:hypothetical protein